MATESKAEFEYELLENDTYAVTILTVSILKAVTAFYRLQFPTVSRQSDTNRSLNFVR